MKAFLSSFFYRVAVTKFTVTLQLLQLRWRGRAMAENCRFADFFLLALAFHRLLRDLLGGPISAPSF
jgi:hypothetical protein